MSKLLGLFVITLVLVGGAPQRAAAQSHSPATEEVPPGLPHGLQLHAPREDSIIESAPMTADQVLAAGPSHVYNQYDMLMTPPAYTESTGTWLRRGWWYTEIDAVVFNRIWNHDDVVLLADQDTQDFSQITGDPIPGSERRLILDKDKPGAEANARLTLGRFLFRDCANRDHTLEFTGFGGGEFTQRCDVSITGDILLVPPEVDGDFNFNAPNNITYDGATDSNVSYSTRYNSFELNYRVKERMGRDQMVMDPCGGWTRRASNGWSRAYLAGLRYFDLSEAIDWDASGFANAATPGVPNPGPNPNNTGTYDVRTDNDLFGFQLGTQWLYETSRWNLGLYINAGPYFNDITSRGAFSRSDITGEDFDRTMRDTAISFVGQWGLVGRYHIRPNFSIKAGWEMLYVTSVALAPHQLDFENNKVVFTGDPFFNGVSLGLDYYW